MEFSRQKNGYDIGEVDSFVKKLQSEDQIKNKRINELETMVEGLGASLMSYKVKKENISSALIAAVDKAKEIEKSSKNVYKLKIQQINLLYEKWQKMFEEMLVKYPKLEETSNLQNAVKNFKESIKTAMEGEEEVAGQISSDNDPIRVLLSKMNSYVKVTVPSQTVQRKQTHKIERIKEEEQQSTKYDDLPNNIKPISNISLGSDESFDNLVDKFLSSDEDGENSAYAKQFIKDENGNYVFPKPNESGFDLEEAINPTEDLDEIMSAFDFFNDGEDSHN